MGTPAASYHSDRPMRYVGKPLTEREESILRMIGEGQLNKNIADFLNLSRTGLSRIISRIYIKAGFPSASLADRVLLIRWAIRLGIVQP